MRYHKKWQSPLGDLYITADEEHLLSVKWLGSDVETDGGPIVGQTIQQLKEYFAGERKNFELPTFADGTEFQKSVWSQLEKIPYGELKTYTDIAEGIGNPKSVRAVGAANGQNPLCVIVPCHRVIGKSGKLVGYIGGEVRKKGLLELEGAL